MVREKKPIVVEQFRDDKRAVQVDICYNPNLKKNYHQATVDGETFTHQEVEKVREWVRLRIIELHSLTWQGIITVRHVARGQHYHPEENKAETMVGFSRWWLARLANGEMRRANWEAAEYVGLHSREAPRDIRTQNSKPFSYRDDQRKVVPFTPPCKMGRSHYQEGDTFYYPYDEGLWAGLLRIKGEIAAVNAVLAGLLTTEADAYLGLTGLGVVGTLLAAGEMVDAAPAALTEPPRVIFTD